MLKSKVVFQCPDPFKLAFKNASCVLTISVGQINHEAHRFLGTLTAINNAFASCDIVVADTLQRHSMALFSKKKPTDLFEDALLKGDEWIRQYNKNISSLKIPYSIKRWDYWLQQPSFNNIKESILKHYEVNEVFRHAVLETIETFCHRLKKRIKPELFDKNKAFQYSFEYLVEECSVQLLWAIEGYSFEIYPTKRNLALACSYRQLIESNFKDTLKPVSLKFKKKIFQAF